LVAAALQQRVEVFAEAQFVDGRAPQILQAVDEDAPRPRAGMPDEMRCGCRS
jgi:hypothetical protein